MREFIKILLIVSLVSALLLLMGCGGKDGAYDPANPGIFGGTYGGASLPIDGNTYAATSSDDEWEVAVKASHDVVDARNEYRPVDMQIQLLDKRCGVTYIFEKRGVMPQLGAVVQTNFKARNIPNATLYTRVYFTKYSLEQRKVVEGTLQLEMPERMDCRNAQQFGNQPFGSQNIFSDSSFQNNQFSNNNSYASDFPTIVSIQLQ